MTTDEFGRTVKEKYPQYSQLSDSDVAQKILEKYPQYKEQIQDTPQVPQGSLFARNQQYQQKEQEKKSLWTRLSDTSMAINNAVGNAAIGFAKGAVDTGSKLLAGQDIDIFGKSVSAPPVIGPFSAAGGVGPIGPMIADRLRGTSGYKQLQETLKPQGTAEKVGHGIERAAEFLIPSGAEISGVGTASKLLKPGVAKKALDFGQRVLLEGSEQAARGAMQRGSTEGAGTDFALGAAFPVVGAALKGAGRVAGEALGITTGAGYGAIRQAFRDSSQEFKNALRGNIDDTMTSVLGKASDALDVIKNNRQAEYRKQLEQIKGLDVGKDLDVLKKKALDNIKSYGVKVTENGLDFGRSKIADKSEANRLKEVLDTVMDWGSQEGDNTVTGLDTLKQRLDDFYSDSSQVRSYVATLRKDVADSIKKAVPEYATMTKGYQEATQLIKDIQSGLSLKGEKTNPDTAIRKLSSILRENNEKRKALLEALEQASGTNIKGDIAGAQLNQLAPRGWGSKIVGGVGTVGALAVNPVALIPGLAAASPRVVGEFVNLLGRAYASTRGVAPQIIKGAASQTNE